MPPLFSLFGDDTARARRRDPITSHMAADTSSKHLSEMKQRILNLFIEHGDMTDSELNNLYVSQAQLGAWKQVRPDTPRKRRSDLTADGYLVASGLTRVNEFGSPEQVWTVAK